MANGGLGHVQNWGFANVGRAKGGGDGGSPIRTGPDGPSPLELDEIITRRAEEDVQTEDLLYIHEPGRGWKGVDTQSYTQDEINDILSDSHAQFSKDKALELKAAGKIESGLRPAKAGVSPSPDAWILDLTPDLDTQGSPARRAAWWNVVSKWAAGGQTAQGVPYERWTQISGTHSSASQTQPHVRAEISRIGWIRDPASGDLIATTLVYPQKNSQISDELDRLNKMLTSAGFPPVEGIAGALPVREEPAKFAPPPFQPRPEAPAAVEAGEEIPPPPPPRVSPTEIALEDRPIPAKTVPYIEIREDSRTIEAELTGALAQRRAEQKRISAEIAQLEFAAEAVQKNNALKTALDKAEIDLKDANIEIERRNNALTLRKEELSAVTQERDRLAQENDEITAQYMSLADSYQTVSQERDFFRSAAWDNKAALRDVSKERDSLIDERDSLAGEKTQLEQKIETLADELNAVADNRDALDKENREITTSLERHKTELQNERAAKESAQRKFSELVSQHDELRDENQRLIAANTDLTERKNNLQTLLDENIEYSEQQIARAQAAEQKIAELEKQLAEAQLAARVAAAQAKDKETQIEKIEKARDEALLKAGAATSELEHAQKDIEGLRVKVDKMQHLNEELAEELAKKDEAKKSGQGPRGPRGPGM